MGGCQGKKGSPEIAWVDYFSTPTFKFLAISPVTPVRHIGRVVIAPGMQLIRSPVKQISCVYYRVTVEEFVKGSWQFLFAEAKSIDFYLYDPLNPRAFLVAGGAHKLQPFQMIGEEFVPSSQVIDFQGLLNRNQQNVNTQDRQFRCKEVTVTLKTQVAVISPVDTITVPGNPPIPVFVPSVIRKTDIDGRSLLTEQPSSPMWHNLTQKPVVLITDDYRAFNDSRGKTIIIPTTQGSSSLPATGPSALDYYSSITTPDDAGPPLVYAQPSDGVMVKGEPVHESLAGGHTNEYLVQTPGAGQASIHVDHAETSPGVNASTGFESRRYNADGVLHLGSNVSNGSPMHPGYAAPASAYAAPSSASSQSTIAPGYAAPYPGYVPPASAAPYPGYVPPDSAAPYPGYVPSGETLPVAEATPIDDAPRDVKKG